MTTPARKIMIVEDNATHARLLTMMLNNFGYDVETLVCGEKAFASVKEFCPEVVMCDLMMEPMDGFQFVRMVKDATGCEDTTLIAMTAADSRFRELALKYGFTHFISKPFVAEELRALLADIFSRKQPPG